MSAGKCGAQLDLGGNQWATCVRHVDAHEAKDHLDGQGREWPACSQHCLADHPHGRYRRRMGVPTGSAKAENRAPRPDKAPKWRTRCKICMERAELAGGICKDRAACEARVPPLFTESEAP